MTRYLDFKFLNYNLVCIYFLLPYSSLYIIKVLKHFRFDFEKITSSLILKVRNITLFNSIVHIYVLHQIISYLISARFEVIPSDLNGIR
jgi:hypothetical protein